MVWMLTEESGASERSVEDGTQGEHAWSDDGSGVAWVSRVWGDGGDMGVEESDRFVVTCVGWELGEVNKGDKEEWLEEEVACEDAEISGEFDAGNTFSVNKEGWRGGEFVGKVAERSGEETEVDRWLKRSGAEFVEGESVTGCGWRGRDCEISGDGFWTKQKESALQMGLEVEDVVIG